MKNVIFLLCIIIFCVVATWYIKGMLDEKEFEQRILMAKHSSDTTTQVIFIPRKEENVKVKNPQKVTKQHSKMADSVFQIAFKKGYDSAFQVFAQKTVPEDTTIVFDSQDTLHHTYTPLTGLAIYDFKPYPSKEVITTIVDTVYVPTQNECETPWYNRWYVRVAELGLLGYLVFARSM